MATHELREVEQPAQGAQVAHERRTVALYGERRDAAVHGEQVVVEGGRLRPQEGQPVLSFAAQRHAPGVAYAGVRDDLGDTALPQAQQDRFLVGHQGQIEGAPPPYYCHLGIRRDRLAQNLEPAPLRKHRPGERRTWPGASFGGRLSTHYDSFFGLASSSRKA